MDSLLNTLGSLTKFLGWVMPPRMNQNGDVDLVEKTQKYAQRIQRWQWAVFVTLVVLTFSLITNVVLSWGYQPYIQGFVRKSDYRIDGNTTKSELAQNLASVKRIEIRLLIQDMLNTRMGQCRSTSKGYFTIRLEELMREFREMTNLDWRVPDCSEVVDR